MPTYRSINIELHSQFDIETLPEYFPRSQAYYTKQDITATIPKLIDDQTSTCSVYVPVLPSSQFWVSYSISPPVPEGQQFLFKLFINGAHVVSWSCGKEEEYKGKTMFGLYERELDDEGKKRVEKRAFFFSAVGDDGNWKGVKDIFDLDACVEIHVHRAHGRRRMVREIEEFTTSSYSKKARGIDLVNAGRAGPEHPKRFYKFALIDPVDRPFATFRYFYRTWKQLQELGVLDEESDLSDASLEDYQYGPVIASPQKRKPCTTRVTDDVDEVDKANDVFAPDSTSTKASPARPYYIPRGAPGSERNLSPNGSDDAVANRHSGTGTPPRFYRLSVPPALKLEPSNMPSTNLPTIPRKIGSVSSLSYRPHPAYPVETWAMRTPSPVKSVRDGIKTPPMKERKAFSAASSLISVVASAWKRRGTPTSGTSSRAGNSRNALRTVSDELD
ncbi:hypothetical protein P154DRAFT_620700 [Amniculicola lignicola CBS 123094]|uniref:DUF7918 domain-containing protein n=1 Tax=Amniculicola lignicola CBS 123094 TaxID=1392246 RepID=A0A6A5WQ88_9PLEO|nr:hypothetical protein P154DRAFT_620700 [Amniculicola lignicola CBS 123094]